MALPKLNVPSYNCKLPSDGTRVKFRPFLVKEEKLLFLAMQSGEQSDMMDAVKTIIVQCTDIKNVDKLATFDIEYLFLQIRTRSVGESVEVQITCPDDDETVVKTSIPLDEIQVSKDPKHNRELKLDDETILTMGYPSLDMFIKMNFDTVGENPLEQVFELAATCAETIADKNQVYPCKDYSKKEMVEFFEGMNTKQFQMVQDFFDTMPKLKYEATVINPNTKKENKVVLEGLAAFFE